MFVTSIFNDGRGFVPTTIFVPQLLSHTHYIPIHNNNDDTQVQAFQSLLEETNVQEKIDLSQFARTAFERLAKKKDDTYSLAHNDYNDIEKKFYKIAEKNAYNRAENDYNLLLARRTTEAREEQEAQRKEEIYNAEFLQKLIQKKRLINERKKRKEYAREFLKGLLLGDPDDPSIPKLILGILTAYHPGFLRLWHLTLRRIEPISAISPVYFDYGGGYYARLPDVALNVEIKPYNNMVFAAIYRLWSEQFVRKIIEKRQRGPPLQSLIYKNRDF
ncbi:MAG: hypothetical protein ACJARD_001531 [Alphaproteobacteria bacterium]|jgi:hypothetical protein